jgi:Uma2 family endonuclease
MTQPKPKLKFTVKDYMSTPEGTRYQLLDGEMILAPSPTDKHQRLLANLYRAIYAFVDAASLGQVRFAPLDVVLSNHDVAQPDLLFISNERASVITEANVQGAPDLVVEILSPSTAEYDQGYKRALYAQHGVQEYWLVDPAAETVEVLVLGEENLISRGVLGAGETLDSPLLEGLALELRDLFNRT